MSTLKEASFTGSFSRNVLQTMWFAYRQFKFRLFSLLLMGLLGRGFLLANTNVIGVWVDSFCQPNELALCRQVPVYFQGLQNQDFVRVLVWMTFFGFMLTWLFRIGFSVLSARAVSKIYDETTYRASRFPMAFFDATPTGRIVTRFSSDYGNVFRLFGGPLAEFLSIVFDLIIMVALVGIASPYYLPAILFISLINYFAFKLNQEKLRTSRRELSASRSPSIAHFSETTQGASTIRSFNKQKTFLDRFEKLDRHYLAQKLRVSKVILRFSFSMNFLTALLFLISALVAFYLLKSGHLSVGSVGVAFAFIALSGSTVQMFFEWLAQFEEAMIGIERLDEYLRKPSEPGARLPTQALFPTGHWQLSKEEAKLRAPVNAEVAVKNLNFQYSAELPFVLQDLSFTVKPGERFGIIGRTGSGKSTIIQALLYLYPINSGSIAIDAKSPALTPGAEGLFIETYRQLISYISQDSILFKGLLRDNLDIQGRLSDEKLIQALQKVGLQEYANPAGLQFSIEEKGKNLSLGEKQLVCVARCILQETPVVIMDEATSSIDPKSEEILVRATEEFFAGRTQIIIAHRLSTLKRCDRVLWLHAGKIQQIGPPEEIISAFEKSNLSLQ